SPQPSPRGRGTRGRQHRHEVLWMPAESDLQPPVGGDLNGRARRRPWPRKNTPEQIRLRQDALRGLPHWNPEHDFIFEWPVTPAAMEHVLESFTANVVLPVSVVGPLRVTLAAYHVDAVDGRLGEDGRSTEAGYVAVELWEGGLSYT